MTKKHPNPKTVMLLDSTLESLNALWERAETAFRKIHIPHEVYLRYAQTSPDGDYFENHFLGYVWLSGAWRICQASAPADHEEDQLKWRSIRECRLDIRVAAANHLAELHKLISAEAEAYAKVVQRAEEALRSAVEAIEMETSDGSDDVPF